MILRRKHLLSESLRVGLQQIQPLPYLSSYFAPFDQTAWERFFHHLFITWDVCFLSLKTLLHFWYFLWHQMFSSSESRTGKARMMMMTSRDSLVHRRREETSEKMQFLQRVAGALNTLISTSISIIVSMDKIIIMLLINHFWVKCNIVIALCELKVCLDLHDGLAITRSLGAVHVLRPSEFWCRLQTDFLDDPRLRHKGMFDSCLAVC